MRLSLEIARRYLFGKKSTNAINIISGVSILGITVGTIALILILSVLNGFSGLIKSFLDSFNPDIKVSLKEGKLFELSEDTYQQILAIDGVQAMSKTIEEIAFFEYRNSQEVGTIKGVDTEYAQVTRIDSTIREGEFVLEKEGAPYIVSSLQIASKLGLNSADPFHSVTIYVPKAKKKGLLDKEFKTREVYPSGTFLVQSENNLQYVLASYELVNSLLETKNKCTALEIKLDSESKSSFAQKQIQKLLGDTYLVADRIQQDAIHLRIIEIEKWISFLIVSFTILIVAFNLVGCLWMIVMDKRRDISILRFMGYDSNQIKNIFLSLGGLITLIGIVLGIIISLIVYYLQITVGLIPMSSGFLVQYYPIELRIGDIIVVIIVVFLIGILASWMPAIRASRLKADLRSS